MSEKTRRVAKPMKKNRLTLKRNKGRRYDPCHAKKKRSVKEVDMDMLITVLSKAQSRASTWWRFARCSL